MKIIILQLAFVLGFVFVFCLGISYADCSHDIVIFNQKTKTKIALKDTCGKITAIKSNEDLVVGNQVIIPWYSVLISDLTAEQQEDINEPSVIEL